MTLEEAEARDPRRSHASDSVTRVVVYLAVAYAAVSVLLWARGGLTAVTYPYQLDYGEGSLMDNVRQFAHGGPLYYDFDGLPCNPLVYGPLYPALWSLMYPLAPQSFWPGRLLAFLAMAGTAACLFIAVRARTGRWSLAVVAAGFFLSLSPVRGWTSVARVDSLAVVLSLAGWALFVYVRRLRWAGAFLMVAAVYTKQSMLAAPIAAVMALALAGDRRSALLYLAGMAAMGAAVLAALQTATHGAFMRDTVFAQLANQWQGTLFLGQLGGFVGLAPGAFVVAGLACCVGACDQELRPVALYAALAGLLLLLSGKVGASFNYYLEFCAVASLSLGLLLGRRWAVKSERLSPIFYLSVLAIVQIALTARMPIVPAGPTQDSGAPAMAVQGRGRGSAALTAAVAAEPGEVLSECMGPVVQAGKVLWVEPFVTTQLAVAGRWDQGPLLAMIRRRQFGLVVMSDFELRRPPGANIDVRWTEDERAAMARNYTPVARVGEFWLLRPRMATPPAGSSASQLQGNGEPGEAVGLSRPG